MSDTLLCNLVLSVHCKVCIPGSCDSIVSQNGQESVQCSVGFKLHCIARRIANLTRNLFLNILRKTDYVNLKTRNNVDEKYNIQVAARLCLNFITSPSPILTLKLFNFCPGLGTHRGGQLYDNPSPQNCEALE